MTYIAQPRSPHPDKKHDRSVSAGWRQTPVATGRAEQQFLDGLPDAAALDGLHLPWWRLLPAAARGTLHAWRRRARSRRELARVDSRTLRDAGIDPGAASFEINQPFWRPSLQLRDVHGAE
jgi:uncharacterized protein YjiS (DUF1127 family)